MNRDTKLRSLFSFYGGKSALVDLYPEPRYPHIIEPFAGAANYALRYADRQVTLCDVDPIVTDIWRWLLSPGALLQAEYFIAPMNPSIGDKVSAILPSDAPPGMLRFLQSFANVGTQGAKGIHDQITKFGIRQWPKIMPKLRYFVPRITHWTFHNVSYDTVLNEEATWFIDPPYNNRAGKRYRCHNIDYDRLAHYCTTRMGQVIACENAGATWLDFTDLAPRRGVVSSYQKSRAMEVMYHRTVER